MQLEQLALLGEELWIFHTHTHIYALMHSPSLLACLLVAPMRKQKEAFQHKAIPVSSPSEALCVYF